MRQVKRFDDFSQICVLPNTVGSDAASHMPLDRGLLHRAYHTLDAFLHDTGACEALGALRILPN